VYKLMNSPFFARGVSHLDIVRAAPREDGTGLQFAGVLDHAGHSTYMILATPKPPGFEEYWGKLEALGCTYESTTINTRHGKKLLYSVDVPTSTDLYAVYAILEDAEKQGVWMFQEGHVGHKLNNK